MGPIPIWANSFFLSLIFTALRVSAILSLISDFVQLRACLVYCRAVSRTAKSASTAEVAQHGTCCEAEACVKEWFLTDSQN